MPLPPSPSASLRLLVVASETKKQRDARRRSSGAASHESYAQALNRLREGLALDWISCVDGPDAMTAAQIASFDAVFFAGSPIQMHEDGPETRAAAGFMARVFEAGTPSFGSCAGLQIAAVAAGGATGPRQPGIEAGFARDIVPTPDGRDHPMLAGRPPVWTAPAMHSSVVTRAPRGARILASNADTPVEAIEIRQGAAVFWGVQYHPEIDLAEVAASLRRQSDDLVAQGLARDAADLEDHAARLEALNADPARRDLAWQLGLDDELTDAARRMRELDNFLSAVEARAFA